VRAYEAEIAASDAAHRKRRREALKAECAATPAAPTPDSGARPARARVQADAKRVLMPFAPRAGLLPY
jgi:hypothetical protein